MDRGRLADHLAATRPEPDGFVPGSSMPAGQDVPRPQGLYTAALIAPGEWPEVSESGIARYGQSVAAWARWQDDANSDANAQVAEVLNGSWVSGDAGPPPMIIMRGRTDRTRHRGRCWEGSGGRSGAAQ